ncbi:DUF1972 domain-containing protein [Mariniflexile litorale]|uniref:DUF1972 domain-containing protein n=1 Tax=Mariniflexile litorale TaxID=3045158 RepID=A0AAU7EJR9_9FLAO|nr:DUF1972 domain-containing protein [Mariniflexile sp. KMM 9835]MDQ8211345.1 DUF1972 domain-containing protein [Mariniflexile sp. KMM 9835]
MKNKKVAVIGTVGLPAKYGGFETLVEHLVKNLNKNFDFTVYCSSISYKNKPRTYNKVRLVYLPLSANGKSSIPYDILSIIHSLFYADVILVLGVSGAFILPFIKIFTGKKIITNIDGLEWKRDKWGNLAKKYLKLQEKIAVNFSHNVVVDNKGIQKHVEKVYNKKSSLIAYGGDHVFKKQLQNHTIKMFNIPKEYAFKVCRIEPENNIHVVLKAFAQTNFNLIIVGNWNNNEYGKTLKMKYKNYNNVFLLDPIYDQIKLNELRSNCYLYIHGHSAGGTNPSLVEAMSLELPILAFDVSYNRYTTQQEALYFKNEIELVNNLNLIQRDNTILKINSAKMKAISLKYYTWKLISERYKTLLD